MWPLQRSQTLWKTKNRAAWEQMTLFFGYNTEDMVHWQTCLLQTFGRWSLQGFGLLCIPRRMNHESFPLFLDPSQTVLSIRTDMHMKIHISYLKVLQCTKVILYAKHMIWSSTDTYWAFGSISPHSSIFTTIYTVHINSGKDWRLCKLENCSLLQSSDSLSGLIRTAGQNRKCTLCQRCLHIYTHMCLSKTYH